MKFHNLVMLQVLALVGTALTIRTGWLWIFVPLSFVSPIVASLGPVSRKGFLVNLTVLLITLHLLNTLAQPPYGLAWGSDAVGDIQIVRQLLATGSYQIGAMGFGPKPNQYSLYPILHVFTAAVVYTSGFDILPVALWIIPALNGLIVGIAATLVFDRLFGLAEKGTRVSAVLVGTAFYYGFFQAQFVRETIGFPLAVLVVSTITLRERPTSRKITSIILLAAVVVAHHFTSYILVALLLVVFFAGAVAKRLARRSHGPEMGAARGFGNFALIALVLLLSWVGYLATSSFVHQSAASLSSVLTLLTSPERSALPAPVLPFSSIYERALGFLYYGLFIFFGIGGWLLGRRHHLISFEGLVLSLLGFLALGVSAVLRLLSTDPWSYDLALRSLTWIAVFAVPVTGVGLLRVSGVARAPKAQKLIVAGVMMALAMGCLSQFPPELKRSDVAVANNVSVNSASEWLATNGVQGGGLLYVRGQPVTGSLLMMESLANLVLYPPADNPGRPYTGYILMYPGSSFERLETVLQVDRIYDDGSLQIAYGDAVPYAVLLAAQA